MRWRSNNLKPPRNPHECIVKHSGWDFDHHPWNVQCPDCRSSSHYSSERTANGYATRHEQSAGWYW